MRYLLCAAILLAACERRNNMARDTTSGTDTMAMDTTAGPVIRPQTMSAVPDRLIGSWTAKGYDAGSKRPQAFTITWSRSADGSLGGRSRSPRGRSTT